MSGLLMRLVVNAGQVGFRGARSKQLSGFMSHSLSRSVARHGSIDHTICFLASSRISSARSLLFYAHRGRLIS
jgi:hypothetical protein